jgi:hypothetical protein
MSSEKEIYWVCVIKDKDGSFKGVEVIGPPPEQKKLYPTGNNNNPLDINLGSPLDNEQDINLGPPLDKKQDINLGPPLDKKQNINLGSPLDKKQNINLGSPLDKKQDINLGPPYKRRILKENPIIPADTVGGTQRNHNKRIHTTRKKRFSRNN